MARSKVRLTLRVGRLLASPGATWTAFGATVGPHQPARAKE